MTISKCPHTHCVCEKLPQQNTLTVVISTGVDSGMDLRTRHNFRHRFHNFRTPEPRRRRTPPQTLFSPFLYNFFYHYIFFTTIRTLSCKQLLGKNPAPVPLGHFASEKQAGREPVRLLSPTGLRERISSAWSNQPRLGAGQPYHPPMVPSGVPAGGPLTRGCWN